MVSCDDNVGRSPAAETFQCPVPKDPGGFLQSQAVTFSIPEGRHSGRNERQPVSGCKGPDECAIPVGLGPPNTVMHMSNRQMELSWRGEQS